MKRHDVESYYTPRNSFGNKTLKLHVCGQKVDSVTVDMLEPRFDVAGQFVPRTDAEAGGMLEAGGNSLKARLCRWVIRIS